jgi:hypothetical protein
MSASNGRRLLKEECLVVEEVVIVQGMRMRSKRKQAIYMRPLM